MKAGLEVLKPLLTETMTESKGIVIVGTVKGDLHDDIGKNLVTMVLEGAGFHVIDVGVNVAPEAFMMAVKDSKAKVVGLSALLTTTMLAMQATVSAMREAGLAVKTMIEVAPHGGPCRPDQRRWLYRRCPWCSGTAQIAWRIGYFFFIQCFIICHGKPMNGGCREEASTKR